MWSLTVNSWSLSKEVSWLPSSLAFKSLPVNLTSLAMRELSYWSCLESFVGIDVFFLVAFRSFYLLRSAGRLLSLAFPEWLDKFLLFTNLLFGLSNAPFKFNFLLPWFSSGLNRLSRPAWLFFYFEGYRRWGAFFCWDIFVLDCTVNVKSSSEFIYTLSSLSFTFE